MLNSINTTATTTTGLIRQNEINIEDYLNHESTSFEIIGTYYKEGKSKEITVHYGIIANTYCVTSDHHKTEEFDNVIKAFNHYNSL